MLYEVITEIVAVIQRGLVGYFRKGRADDFCDQGLIVVDFSNDMTHKFHCRRLIGMGDIDEVLDLHLSLVNMLIDVGNGQCQKDLAGSGRTVIEMGRHMLHHVAGNHFPGGLQAGKSVMMEDDWLFILRLRITSYNVCYTKLLRAGFQPLIVSTFTPMILAGK